METSRPQTTERASSVSGANKTAANATADEMLGIAGFRERISERQSNHYEPHDAELANSQLDDRVAAIFDCLQRAKAG